MSLSINYGDEHLEVARKLVVALESKDDNAARELIVELTNSKETVIFQEIGKLTRELHDTLQGFESDINLSDMATIGIPDAKQRLNYVIEKTQEAADNTLTIIEGHIPDCERLEIESKILASDWTKFMSKDMDADDFRTLAKRLTIYFEDNKASYKEIIVGMNEIIMAQGFQDITGQIIKKVISLVQEVEDNLIRVIRVTDSTSTYNQSKKDDGLEGPQVPGLISSDDVLSGQDEVDDLLSSLGF